MSHPNVFDTDNYIFIWETYNYMTPFASAFEAFSKNPVFTLKALAGKTVCFKNLMLPLLPRMIFGLYYNTPIVGGTWFYQHFKLKKWMVTSRNLPCDVIIFEQFVDILRWIGQFLTKVRHFLTRNNIYHTAWIYILWWISQTYHIFFLWVDSVFCRLVNNYTKYFAFIFFHYSRCYARGFKDQRMR